MSSIKVNVHSYNQRHHHMYQVYAKITSSYIEINAKGRACSPSGNDVFDVDGLDADDASRYS